MAENVENNSVVLFEKAMTRIEKDVTALNLLLNEFEKTGYKKHKYNAKFNDMMDKFAKLVNMYSKTEYDLEGPYTGPQMAERYKNSVAKKWGDKSEKFNSVTEDEIKDSYKERIEKLEELQIKRQQYLLESPTDYPDDLLNNLITKISDE